MQVVPAPAAEAFYCAPVRLPEGRFGERVEWWLELSEAMRACVKVAASLKKALRPRPKNMAVFNRSLIYELGQPPVVEQILPEHQLNEEAELCAQDGDLIPEVAGARFDGFRSRAWNLILELLNKWLVACPVRLYFTYADTRPVDFSMSFVAGDQRGCFPALVFALIGRIRAKRGEWMVNCAHCGLVFSPRREPKAGERMYCESCRAEKWPMRQALRDYYARNRTKILVRRKQRRRAMDRKRKNDENTKTRKK